MKFAHLLFVSLLSGLILAEDVDTATEKGKVMETGLKNNEYRLLQLSDREGTKVIFTATTRGLCNRIMPFSADDMLIYPIVIRNNGVAYSPETGIFVAPVAGVYYFYIFLYTSGSHSTSLSLCKNNEQMLMIDDILSNSSRADNGGNTFLQLKQGDQIYVRLSADTHDWGIYCYSTFSGSLVTQM